MEKLCQLIRETFSLNEKIILSEKTYLREIPGWDSMNAVNLEIAIETAYGVEPSQLELTDDTSLTELAAQLEKKRP
jgi:acyl carrier protein